MSDDKDKFKKHIKQNYIPDVLSGKRQPKGADTETATGSFSIFTELRDLQKNAASKPRPNWLTSIIESYVKIKPDITCEEVINKLDYEAMNGSFIQTVAYDAEVIIWLDKQNREKETSFAAINTRLSRIKKKK